MEAGERKEGCPEVKAERSFLQIVEDFTDPREVLREAISNALDWGASTINITAYLDATRADRELVMKIWDDGLGLTRQRFLAFWNLGDSPGLEIDEFGRKVGDRVGEKGHGTKTFWKCRRIELESVASEEDGSDWHVLAEMNEPINTLMQQGKVPRYHYVEGSAQGEDTFTEVTIRGYHSHSKEDFRHEILKDYIQWFTKFGSVELQLDIVTHKDKVIRLQGLGRNEPEVIKFGHSFPPEDCDTKALQKQYGDSWRDYYVKKWTFCSEPIDHYPSSRLDFVFYLKGDTVKRRNNEMLRRPFRTSETWQYTVSDRYGLYLCRDWIPLAPSQRVSEWIAEKMEWTLYHTFVNCQDLQLTANRGSVGNTDRDFLAKVQETVQRLFKTRIKASEEYKAYEEEIELTKQRTRIERTEEDEEADLEKRYYYAKKKRLAPYRPPQRPSVVLVEPRQEAEVLILYSVVSALKPDLFEFEIVDYSTSRGIDALCILKTAQGGLQKGNLRYVEFKRALTHDFKDHTFARLAAVVCWECNLENGASVRDLAGRERKLQITKGEDQVVYMLLAPPELATNHIKVYVLKEYLNDKLGISFKTKAL